MGVVSGAVVVVVVVVVDDACASSVTTQPSNLNDCICIKIKVQSTLKDESFKKLLRSETTGEQTVYFCKSAGCRFSVLTNRTDYTIPMRKALNHIAWEHHEQCVLYVFYFETVVICVLTFGVNISTSPCTFMCVLLLYIGVY